MKNIGQVCQPCTPLITCKQLCIIGPLICQKHFKFLSQLIHTGQHLAARQPSDPRMKQQGFVLRSHFLTKSKYVTFHRSWLHKVYHPPQERGLLVKSWLRGLRDVKNSVWWSHLGFFPSLCLQALWCIWPWLQLHQCRHSCSFSHLSPPFSGYTDVTRKISSPIVFLWLGLHPQNAHWPRVEHVHLYCISRLIKLQRKFITDTELVQNHTFNICRQLINTSGNCVIWERDFGSEHLIYNGFVGRKH